MPPLPSVRNFLLDVEKKMYFTLKDHSERKRSGKRELPAHLRTGERGEDEAFFYLRKLGYTVVARRWRSERLRGDLDLVAWDGDTLVIFEVKTRTARDMAPAETAIDAEKERMLRRMSAAYIRQFPPRHRDRVQSRFDVVAVYLLGSGVEFEHFQGALTRR
jgi:putative endonuclease